MVKIIADSCCDLSPELIKRFDIEIVPLSVFVDNQDFLDGVELSQEKLFAAVNKTGILPKTSAPSVAEFTAVFKKYPEFICFTISSKMSASYQNGLLALENLPDHKGAVIDSMNLSTGIGLLVLRAAELSQQGKSLEEIVATVQGLVGKVNSSFIIDTLDYLDMGGRCSAMEHVVGSLLKIRPIIEVRRDGTMGVREKVSGSRKKGLNSLLEHFAGEKETIDPARVFITYTTCDDDASYLREELKKLLDIQEICLTYAGATISSHCGPDTIGILYFTK
jgi:DegV family protein with EDD domain